jgi:hypothetical protein
VLLDAKVVVKLMSVAAAGAAAARAAQSAAGRMVYFTVFRPQIESNLPCPTHAVDWEH